MANFLFVVTLGLWVLTAWRVSRWVGGTRGVRFWVFVAGLSVQLGVIGQALSVPHVIGPAGWIICQAALAGASMLLRAKPVEIGPRERWTAVERVLLGLVVAFVLAAAIEQWGVPVRGVDERGYHASRAAYWLQHRSVGPWVTHNERQVLFPFGGELYFFFPLVFTRAELPGRMVFFGGFVALVAGVIVSLRDLGARRAVALLAGLVVATTPAVYRLAAGLKTDIWLTVFVIGFAYFAARVARGEGRAATTVMLGIMLALAVNVKTTAMALVVPAVVLPMLLRREERMRAVGAMVTAAVVTVVAGGLLVPWGTAVARYGNPLGSWEMRKVHQPAYSVGTTLVTAARIPFVFAEVPVWGDGLRGAVERAGNVVADAIGATRPLELESADADWPGLFRYELFTPARRYSAVGLLFLPVMAVAIWCCVRELRRREVSPLVGLTFVAVVALGSNVFGVRWMGGGPERFWVPGYVAGVMAGAWVVAGWGRIGTGVVAILLGWQIVGVAADHVGRVNYAVTRDYPTAAVDEPFEYVLPAIPADARVLLVASQSIADYGIFGPREGFGRYVISWGLGPFDREGFEQIVRRERVTHVLLENEVGFDMHWHRPVFAGPFLTYLRGDGRFREVRVAGGLPRLFVVTGSL